MRAVTEITGDIGKTKNKLETLEQTIRAKQGKLVKLKQSHTQWLTSNIGKERMPRSLAKQRENMAALAIEIESFQSVQANLESKLSDLKQELARANLYENQLKQFREVEQKFLDMAASVVNEVDELNTRLDSCKANITAFLEKARNPLEIMRLLIKENSLSGLSLPRFFDGEIVEMEAGENEAFIREIAAGYGQLPRKLPTLTDAKDSWIALSNYFDFISRAACELVPRTVKYVSTEQKISPPSPNRSQSVPVNPRNLAMHDAQKQRERDLMEWNRNRRSMGTT